MPLFERGATTIYYEDHGSGFPLLALAPGGMLSAVAMWQHAAINPLAEYGDDFRLVVMDQRNAGRSTGPLDIGDPWGSYVGDQLALLDHLDIDTCHMMGCCIGAAFILKLLEREPDRVAAAVLQQPIGIADGNAALFDKMWRAWGTALAEEHPDVEPTMVEQFGTAMWDGGEFAVSVSKDFVRTCPTPMLVLPGIDEYHPTVTGREIAALAPRAEVFEPWRDTAEHVAQGIVAVRRFLQQHTPRS